MADLGDKAGGALPQTLKFVSMGQGMLLH